MEHRLSPYAERQAPRYTSYPSAPHFTPEIDAAAYRAWLAALDPSASVSLYVHVPYCSRICWYCGCNTNAAHPGDTADFVDLLLHEIDLVAGAVGARRVAELHWGGGTPNILNPEEFVRIFRHLGFWFDLAQPLMHSIEIDPRCLREEQVRVYADLGVNRASIGVQTLAPHIQHAIGRVQPFELVEDAVALLRKAGVKRINFDLMYGLPEQTEQDLLETIATALTLEPDRIALFGYAHVPWFKRRQRVINAEDLPGPAARFDQADAARKALRAAGYAAIGLDHFARPDDPLALAARAGRLHRNFQGYVASAPDAILGFGPSAISTLPQGFAQNHAHIGAWRRAIDMDESPIARGHATTEDDRLRASLIDKLMCAFEADLGPLGGREAFANEMEALAALQADGLVIVEGDRIAVPESMRPFCRLVAQAFDAYASGASHSSAV